MDFREWRDYLAFEFLRMMTIEKRYSASATCGCLRKLAMLMWGLLLSAGFAFAQVADGSMPASFSGTLKTATIIPVGKLQPVDAARLQAIDEQEGVNNRYGVLQTMNINLCEKALRSQVGTMNVWRYRLSGSGVYALGLNFSIFDIPEGAALYVYSADGKLIRGGFTSRNSKPNGGLTLADFPDDELIIEYNEPVDAAFHGGVILGSVSSAYVELSTKASNRIQINCVEGEDWQAHKRAVCLITFNDGQNSYYCTGFLVNNVNEDGTPFFLTARHCISSAAEASTLVAYFNYENSSCTADDASREQTVSGASLLASGSASDFTLVRLDEEIPQEYEPFFAGWDASDNNPQSGTCIHHPNGAPKSLAQDNDEVFSNDTPIIWEQNEGISEVDSHWEVFYDVGSDENGSSGAPLFDHNKRVVGQLHGGDNSTSLFGKFSWSWDRRAGASSQLKYWLDPDNTGVVQMDGFDSTAKPIAAFSPNDSILCLSEILMLNDQTKYAPQSWEWSISPATYSYVNGTDEHSQNPQVLFTAEGSYTISLITANDNGTDQLTRDAAVSVFAQLPVALAGLPDEMTICGRELDNYEFWAEGASDFSFEITAAEKFTTSVQGQLLTVGLTDEARQEGSFDTYVKVTGTQGACSSADSVLIHVIIPANDNIAQAIGLNLGYNGLFSNDCASIQDREPGPGTAEDPENSVWFYFEGPSSEQLTVQVDGIDSEIAVYRAATPVYLLSGSEASYLRVASASGSGLAVMPDLDLVAGGKYWLQVDGINGDEGEMSIQLLSNTIEVYPNPSTGIFHLTVASVLDGDAEMAVYNSKGQQVYAGNGLFNQQANTVDFDLSGNPAGLYYFRAMINGALMTKILVLVK